MEPKYRSTTMEFKYLKSHVSVPKFQRGIVWNKTKRENLIETIKKGLPIGSLLLSAIGTEEYKIIDGLQRFTTLEEYSRNPMRFITKEDITIETIKELIKGTKAQKIYNDLPEESRGPVFDKVQEIIYVSAKDKKSTSQLDFADVLIENLEDSFIDSSEQRLFRNVISIYENYTTSVNINQLTIPVIVFTGKEYELVEVYQKLNSEGIKLSKYDIFAASWSEVIIHLKDDSFNLMNHIVKRYSEMYKNSDIEINDYNPDAFKLAKEVNLFEYCYAIGKVISQKSNLLFKTRKSTNIDSLGFTLLALFYNVKNNQMKVLSDQVLSKELDLNDFLEKLLGVIDILENDLDPYLRSLDLKKVYTPHTEFQICSYIMFLFNLKYSRSNGSITNKQSSSKKVKLYSSFIHKHYLFDIVRNHWSGSGDTTMDNLVLNEVSDSHRLLNDINEETFRSTIYNYLTEENTNTKLSIRSENKLLLNYLLRLRVQPQPSTKVRYDFDHIIPKARFDVKIDVKKFMAISSPCNLCIIPSSLNRSKGERTIYEDIERNVLKSVDSKMLENFSYPLKSELVFISDPNTFTLDSYNSYLKSRANYITNKIINKLYNKKEAK